ncbi:MAG: hypothetical protein ACP5OV_05295 [Acidimicrobiales bacterium]
MTTSTTRRDLERAVRDLVPSTQIRAWRDDPATTALAGAGGLVTGFVWGFWRARRRARARARARRR